VSAPRTKYFEDFAHGEAFETPPVQVTADDIIRFAAAFDPQPMHLSATAPGGLIASGWHTASLTMRLFVTSGWYAPPQGALGMGVQDLTWPRPVHPGALLRLRIEVTGLRISRSKPGFGILSMRMVTLTQDGDAVQTMTTSVLIPRRSL
jgi:acyl dehydratase